MPLTDTPEATAPRIDRLVVIPHIGAGGAQRVATLLLNHWQAAGVRCALITLFPAEDAYTLDPLILREDFQPGTSSEVGRHWLSRLYLRLEKRLQSVSGASTGLKHSTAELALDGMRWVRRVRAFILTTFFVERVVLGSSRVRRLRKRFVELNPPVIISFLGATNIQTLLAARGLGLPVLISERNDPALQRLDPPWERLRPRIYPEADIVTANSAGALKTMRAYVPEHKLRQVSNPLKLPPCPAAVERRQRRLIAVARLVHQKGYDLLLPAFAQVAAAAPEWRLDIVGDGPLREELEASAAALGIAERVCFHGHQRDPFPLLYAASVFVLPSRFEGMPNAMLEAMGCGLAICVSDASPGPLELIRDHQTGLVARSEDVASLAAALGELVADGLLRERLAAAALEVAGSMQLEQVSAHWEQLIGELNPAAALSAPAT